MFYHCLGIHHRNNVAVLKPKKGKVAGKVDKNRGSKLTEKKCSTFRYLILKKKVFRMIQN
ncbi:hypothetical protein M23134_01374 [Microscilla marina ATCC 23134]|uniref:Uncharacterized protein n=1 Tax=Microscilla marina ATCC 23134 TaxID=313606 RepID=A1ZJL6_MICM2|nr:hypothetical protein M23134_01374 [Microscilla marina ATCC 23134]